MPTIIDSLVVELGLNPSNFSKGAQDAIDKLKKLEDAEDTRSKTNATAAKRQSEAISGLKTQALELFAVLSGGKGFIEFVSGLTEADSAVGRVSRSTGIGVTTISKWQGAARILGGDAASMAQSFIKLNDAFEGFRHGFGDPQMLATLAGISRAGGVPIDINKGVEETYLALADNLKAISEREGPGAAGAIGRRFGLDATTLDMLMKGRDYTKQILDHVMAMGPATEATADAAGELERRWNSIFLRTEGTGRQVGIIPAILAASDFLNMTPSEAWAYLNRTDRATQGLAAKPKSLTPGFDATPPSGDSRGYRKAISDIESRGSGGYSALGPVTRSGDRAYGKYQIMGNNIGEWSQATLGKKISIDEFMSSPELQDKIFDHRFGQYVKQFGNPQDAASAWLTGKPLSGGANLRDQNGTSGAQYAARFTAGLGGSGSSSTSVAITGPITINAGGNASASDIASKLRDLGLKRQHDANQSSVGGE